VGKGWKHKLETAARGKLDAERALQEVKMAKGRRNVKGKEALPFVVPGNGCDTKKKSVGAEQSEPRG
jgi:hypothetical protein